MNSKLRTQDKPIEILLVEDNNMDAMLMKQIFKESNFPINLNVTRDGEDALAYLKHEGSYSGTAVPDLILLDLNLPKLDGREVLAQIKGDPRLRDIPTVILTTSEAEADILKSYRLRANSYLAKPIQVSAFENLVKSINEFWLVNSKLPPSRLFVGGSPEDESAK